MNVALLGLSPQAELELLWDMGLDLRDKLVIQFIFEGNDLLDSKTFRTGGSGVLTRSTLTDYIWMLLTRATDRQRGFTGLQVCSIEGQTYTLQWARNSFEGVESEASIITHALEAADTRIRAAGGRYKVVFIPTKLRVLTELCRYPVESAIQDPAKHLGPLHRHLLAWGAAKGVPVLDLTESLSQAAKAGRIPWFWGDTHWNEFGHEAAAKALDRWLVSRE
jgi:hypothetical protein